MILKEKNFVFETYIFLTNASLSILPCGVGLDGFETPKTLNAI